MAAILLLFLALILPWLQIAFQLLSRDVNLDPTKQLEIALRNCGLTFVLAE